MESEYSNDEYTVAWICALQDEFDVAIAMLSHEHGLPQHLPESDSNAYILGEIGEHKIVLACLPAGRTGVHSAAAVVENMRRTFSSLRFGLLVGIGGGVPNLANGVDIRLGDIAVSVPHGPYGGVVQYDYGKSEAGDTFNHCGQLNSPPEKLLSYVSILQSFQRRLKNPRNLVRQFLDELDEYSDEYGYPDIEDRLFRPDCMHTTGPDQVDECNLCDTTQLVHRKRRRNSDPAIHLGLIASGNTVIRDSTKRDRINREYGNSIICFEMEAAGLMNNFPCLVIRGISDYADSHKNDNWRYRAIATASAYAKSLLTLVRPSEVSAIPEIRKVMATVQEVNQNISHVQQHVQKGFGYIDEERAERERNDILEWLTPLDYEPQLSDTIRRRYESTGEWILASSEYQEWINGKKKTMFCPGIPGAGKTVLTAISVYDLYSRFEGDEGIGIAYIFFDFQRRDEQTLDNLLLSLLKQLLQYRNPLPKSIQDIHHRYKTTKIRPSTNDIVTLLEYVATTFSKIFILVDALDECQTADGCRMNFLTKLLNLQGKVNFQLFTTSRNNEEIAAMFQDCLTLSISASAADITKYVNGQMKRLQPDIIDDEIRALIEAGVLEASRGMFLLAALHMNTLADQPTRGDIKTTLKNLAKGVDGLDATYRQAMERIESHGLRSRSLAKETLLWIIHAKRQLSVEELRHALAVRMGTKELDKDYLPSTKVLSSVCAGLVTIDEESGIIRLVHYTTLEFFMRNKKEWFQNADSEIAKTCVTYLSFDSFQTGPCQTDEDFETRMQENALYDYAARNWACHTQDVLDTTTRQLILNFLEKDTSVSACFQAIMITRVYSEYSQGVPKQMTGLHLAAYFGLTEFVAALLEAHHDPSPRDDKGWTPLHWAIRNKREATAKLLVDNGADPRSRSDGGWTPLHWASRNGNEAVVKLMLAHGADPNSRSEDGWTPLHAAVENCDEVISQLLLSNGAYPGPESDYDSQNWFDAERSDKLMKLLHKQNIPFSEDAKLIMKDLDVPDNFLGNYDKTPWLSFKRTKDTVVFGVAKATDPGSQDEYSCRTPLQSAARKGYDRLVKLLVENGADLDSKDGNGNRAIHLAAGNGQEGAVKILLDSGADLNSKNNSGLTPLHKAAEGGHNTVVKFLLERGALINQKGVDGLTVLHTAAKENRYTTVKLLHENGAGLNEVDNDGRTALYLAAVEGHQALVKLLLDLGANITATTNDDRTVLHPIADIGSEEVLDILLERGADVNVINGSSHTPLHLASMKGRDTVVKKLLDKGADPALGNTCCTPLYAAANEGFSTTVELLLANGAPPDQGKDTFTPLDAAATNGHIAVMMMLLDKGAEVNHDNDHNIRAIHLATQKNHTAAVKLLLERGAKLTRTDTSATPLHTAAGCGFPVIVELLLDNGEDPNIALDSGSTSLHLAVRNEHKSVVEILLIKGANPNMKDHEGLMPLHIAAERGNVALIETLIKHGADTEAKDESNQLAPLHWAQVSDREAAVLKLLEHGVDYLVDKSGSTTLHWAALGSHESVAKLLLDKGAPSSPKTDEGWTPLHSAVVNGNVGVMKLLLDHGADMEANGHNSRITPLSLAAYEGHENAVKLLLEYGANIEYKGPENKTPLFTAAVMNNKGAVKELLEYGADVNTVDVKGQTPLSWATENNEKETAQLILHKFPVESDDSDYSHIQTPSESDFSLISH